MSGKSTLVNEWAEAGDLILDIERLWASVCNGDKPDSMKRIVFMLRDNLLDAIRLRQGTWPVAWVVGTYPLLGERERLSLLLNAECIHVDTGTEECLKRCNGNIQRINYVGSYFEKFQPPPRV